MKLLSVLFLMLFFSCNKNREDNPPRREVLFKPYGLTLCDYVQLAEEIFLGRVKNISPFVDSYNTFGGGLKATSKIIISIQELFKGKNVSDVPLLVIGANTYINGMNWITPIQPSFETEETAYFFVRSHPQDSSLYVLVYNNQGKFNISKDGTTVNDAILEYKSYKKDDFEKEINDILLGKINCPLPPDLFSKKIPTEKKDVVNANIEVIQ